MKFRGLILFCSLFFTWSVVAQVPGNSHSRTLYSASDTVQLDTLSLVPGSFHLFSGNTELDTSFYRLNIVSGQLFLLRSKMDSLGIKYDSLTTKYQTFPFLFSEELKHKDLNRIKPELFANDNPFNYTIVAPEEDIFKMDGLNKSGSISRGISFGNNQDVVVNSNLNLQLSGHLSNNVDILMAATDSNIPIQPDGNTQQLQEFDKVFIQLSNERSKLIAGDFMLTRPNSYFLNFNKKAQGISFTTVQPVRNRSTDSTTTTNNRTTLSAAVSRGKFAKNQIQGIENNQGPYRLRGAENENFIVVLSGSEKVYIDGRLLERGMENDYVINYNTAEITFTPKELITKDKRIVVEFQYSDKNYARSLVHFGDDYNQEKFQLHLHVYSEQDSKNQPLQQDLSSDQKQLLARIGDTLSLAVTPGYDSIAFNNSEVLYQKKDSVIGTHTYPNIFVYSTDSDSAHYRVTFSNVGQGNGNYKQISSSANGKVFQWILPDTITGTLQGNYEPVVQLITPKKKQLVSAGMDYLLGKNSKLSIEGALSNNDLNTFSSADSRDDLGYAARLSFENNYPLLHHSDGDSTKHLVQLLSKVNYEYVQADFSPIERYRSVEFERDWNRSSTSIAADQHLTGASLGLKDNQLGFVNYQFSTLLEGSDYRGFKHAAGLNFHRRGFELAYDGSLMNSTAVNTTQFYRHKSAVSQTIRWVQIGLKDEYEQNKFALGRRDSLLNSSYRFWEWQAFAQNSDTTKTRFGINYKNRTDYNVLTNAGTSVLHKSSIGENYGAFFDYVANPKHQIKLTAAYRQLHIIDTTSGLQPDNTLVGRLEYNLRLYKGAITAGTYYEIGSGLEVKKEYSYLEVPAGQGIYTWIDYNANGIKELNEFEIAAFPDQATYIKVYTPTDERINVYSNAFSQTLLLKPAAVWLSKTGFRKFIARFANQTAYRVDRKSTETDLALAYNPFLAEPSTTSLVSLNSSFRNTLYFNQLSPVAGLDLSFQDIRNKSLLVNGFDTRVNTYEEGHFRWNLFQQLNLELNYKEGQKSANSQYFSTRDFSIHYQEALGKLSYQPTTAFRLSGSFKYTDKKNKETLGGQRAILQDVGLELKYNVLQKGSLNLHADYILITFTGESNTSLSFEMLDALKTGKNMTWGASYSRNLNNNLQLSLTYDGRASEGNKVIHTGGAQVRAYF